MVPGRSTLDPLIQEPGKIIQEDREHGTLTPQTLRSKSFKALPHQTKILSTAAMFTMRMVVLLHTGTSIRQTLKTATGMTFTGRRVVTGLMMTIVLIVASGGTPTTHHRECGTLIQTTRQLYVSWSVLEVLMGKPSTKMETFLVTGISTQPEQVAIGSTKMVQRADFGHLMITMWNQLLVIGTIWTTQELEPGLRTQMILLSGI